MTQTYRDARAVLWMQNDRCPECGNAADEHSSAQQFWVRDPLACSLLPRGVADRIAKQREIDEEAQR